MIKKTITYTDYNDVPHTEDFYFDLSEAELAEMELNPSEERYSETLKRIAEEENWSGIIRELKHFILKSYGEKSADGKRFVKSDEISEAFSQTRAYSKLFMELAGNERAVIEFFNGIIPGGIPTVPAN